MAMPLLALLLAAAPPAVEAQVQLRADNVQEVLECMTLREKATLLVGYSKAQTSEQNGMIGAHADLVPGAAGMTRPIERLGIPSIVLVDGPAGVRISPTRAGTDQTYYATGFPVGALLAATWNLPLVEEVGESIGNEVKEYGCDVLLAPGMNIQRSPLCGRNFEYYSEDPLLTGRTAAAYVRGIQSQGVGTSVKHFAVNSQETNRTQVDEAVSQRALREIYLRGFEIAIRESNPWTVMSSYNRLNGPYTQECRELLTTILRDEWGYDGIVMTDWIGKRNTAAQVHAGNDLMEPGNQSQIDDIIEQAEAGQLSIEDIDTCVERILRLIVRTPRFAGYAFSDRPDRQAHAAISRQSAAEGMVLLKNTPRFGEAPLPLSQQTGRLSLFGITSYDFVAGGTGSGDVNKEYTVDLLTGLQSAGFSVSDTLRDLYLKYKVYEETRRVANGINPKWGKVKLPEMPVGRILIEHEAVGSDAAIITLGRQAGEATDRKITDDFNLTADEMEMLQNVCQAFHFRGKPVIVILNMGGVIETASWRSLPDAILMAWQPGQEGGNAVADVLTGKVNPSGRLPQSWPLSIADVPSSQNFPGVLPVAPRGRRRTSAGPSTELVRNTDYTVHAEGLDIGYRYFSTVGQEVAYPFGYGLSYTTFEYSRPQVKATADGFAASVTVTNRGTVAGKEVVQLYVTAPEGSLDKPRIELKAFGKTGLLQPGESQTLTLRVDAADLASYDGQQNAWVTDAGLYQVHFAANACDLRLSGQYRQTKPLVRPCHDVLRPDMEVK